MGSRGFSINRTPPVLNSSVIRGSHFSPFASKGLGPDIPCYEQERNQGLVLDRQLQAYQIAWQDYLLSDLEGRVNWLGENIEWAKMGPVLRSRKDVKEHLTLVKKDYQTWLDNEKTELHELSSSQCALQKCILTFNTSSLELVGAINGTAGKLTTRNGTEVAVFSFNSIYLGPEVEVILCGQRAFSLVSRTTAVINTTFRAIPGTLGGFRGGYSVARSINDSLNDYPRDILICEIGDFCNPTFYNLSEVLRNEAFVSNNVNGPGSGNLRIHPFVIYTSALVRREVQVIRTWANNGQTLSGGFILSYGDYSTPLISHDVSAKQLKGIIETNLNIYDPSDGNIRPKRINDRRAGVGVVNVTRILLNDEEGFEWTVTFTTAVGNISPLNVSNHLIGLGANVKVTTSVNGNEIKGTFKLHFMGDVTVPIAAYESVLGLKQKLLDLPKVQTAFVDRIDPTENCEDGLCPNGPRDSRGMTWTIYITTDESHDDNVTPNSPTANNSRVEGTYYDLTADIAMLTGDGLELMITRGTATSPKDMMQALNVSRPFSLAFGGAGGSYGGIGGAGYSENPVGRTYNDKFVSDLLGGSGGSMRSQVVLFYTFICTSPLIPLLSLFLTHMHKNAYL